MKRVALLAATGVLVAACLGSDFIDSVEGSWVLESGTSFGVPVTVLETHPITMNLDEGQIGGTAACNSYGGEYELSSDGGFRLRGGVAVTEMACEPFEAMDSERQFLEALADVDRATVDEGKLTLTGPNSELTFLPGEEPPAAGAGGLDPDTPVSNTDGFLSGVDGAWQLTSGTVDDEPVPVLDSHPITLTFTEQGLGGTAACNHYGVALPLPDDGSMPEMAMTAMLCSPDEVMQSETAYMTGLQRVTAHLIENDQLTLTGDGVELAFERLPEVRVADLQATVWVLESLVTGETVSSVSGDRATLELFTDGSFIGSTGCRTFAGSYIISGAEVVFTNWGLEGDCPAGLAAQDDHVVAVLGDGFRPTIEGDQLTLWSVGDEGLVFRADG